MPPNPRPQNPMPNPTHTELANALSDLKSAFHEKQSVIDDIGGRVEGSVHLTLCNLQSKAFKAVETIETYQVTNCPTTLVEQMRKGTFTMSKLRDIFSNYPDDDTLSTAIRAVGLLARENIAPFTKDAIVDAGFVSYIVKVLAVGSIRQRCYCANALVQLSHKDTRAKKAIVEAKGSVKELASLLCNGVTLNVGPAKRDAAGALCNLASVDGVPSSIINANGAIDSMIEILSHKPSADDNDAMEITLVAMIRLCRASDQLLKNLQEREVLFKLVPLVKGAVSAYVKKNKHGVRAEAAGLLGILLKNYRDEYDGLMSAGFAGTAEALMHMLGYGSEHEQVCALEAMRALIKVEKYCHFSDKLMGEPNKIVELCLKLLRSDELTIASTMAASLLKTLAHHIQKSLSKIVDAGGVWVLTKLVVNDKNHVRLACAAFILKTLATDRPNLSQKIANTNMVVAKLREHMLMKEPAAGAQDTIDVQKMREYCADLMQQLVMELRQAKITSDTESGSKRQRVSA